MKILQIATLISPDAAYGGPIRVAVNQTRALLDAGHDVTFAAGAVGFGKSLPLQYDGVPVKLFRAYRPIPKVGFSGLFAPGLHSWLKQTAKSADIAHIHMGRDLVTLPTTSLLGRQGTPYVLQTHGMIRPSRHPLSRPVDKIWTRRALEGASAVFYLTPDERIALTKVSNEPLRLHPLPNGVPSSNIVAGDSEGGRIEVLFLARLHERKRPLEFIKMATILHERHPHVQFSMVGPDEGEGAAVSAAIMEAGMGDALKWEGALAPERTAQRMSSSSIYVLPSLDEAFPMSALEAMALGKPVVVTRSCGLAGAIARGKAGQVVDGSAESLAVAVDELVSNITLRAEMGQHGHALTDREFGMPAVRRALENFYHEATSAPGA